MTLSGISAMESQVKPAVESPARHSHSEAFGVVKAPTYTDFKIQML